MPKNWEKETREKIHDLTILLSTAGEEGDEEEHKRVVDEIMDIIKNVRQEERERIKSILQKEIARSDKYTIAPLQRVMMELIN